MPQLYEYEECGNVISQNDPCRLSFSQYPGFAAKPAQDGILRHEYSLTLTRLIRLWCPSTVQLKVVMQKRLLAQVRKMASNWPQSDLYSGRPISGEPATQGGGRELAEVPSPKSRSVN